MTKLLDCYRQTQPCSMLVTRSPVPRPTGCRFRIPAAMLHQIACGIPTESRGGLQHPFVALACSACKQRLPPPRPTTTFSMLARVIYTMCMRRHRRSFYRISKKILPATKRVCYECKPYPGYPPGAAPGGYGTVSDQ